MPETTKDKLSKVLIEKGVLKDERVIAAFNKIDRRNFISEPDLDKIDLDISVGIGLGQMSTQPSLAAILIEALNPQPGNILFEVGSGSGWMTALLAELIGPNGQLFATEIIPELADLCRMNLSKIPELMDRVILLPRDARVGLPDVALAQNGFDRLISTWSLIDVPYDWRQQVRVGGIMVYQVGDKIFKETKIDVKQFALNQIILANY